jgi:hypothetical protein
MSRLAQVHRIQPGGVDLVATQFEEQVQQVVHDPVVARRPELFEQKMDPHGGFEVRQSVTAPLRLLYPGKNGHRFDYREDAALPPGRIASPPHEPKTLARRETEQGLRSNR